MKARRAPGAGRPQKAPEARAGRRVSTRLRPADEARLERLRAHFQRAQTDAEILRIGLAALEYAEGILVPPDEDT